MIRKDNEKKKKILEYGIKDERMGNEMETYYWFKLSIKIVKIDPLCKGLV